VKEEIYGSAEVQKTLYLNHPM